MTFWKHAVAITALTVSASTAQAALVVDQSQSAFNLGLPLQFNFPGFFLSNVPIGQSFTAGQNGRLGALDLVVNGSLFDNSFQPAPATLSLEIRAGDDAAGTLLGSTTQTLSCDTGAFLIGYCTVRFALTPLGITLAAGQQYSALIVDGGSGPGNFLDRGFVVQSGNPYAGGGVFGGPGYGRPDWDMTFQTLIDTGSTVPEPASWALLIAGFGLTGAALRRRRLALA